MGKHGTVNKFSTNHININKEQMEHYNRYQIKPFWNHPNAKIIDELSLDTITLQVLQAVNKWGKVLLYPDKSSGLPGALYKQLGFTPTYKQVTTSLAHLAEIGYIKPINKVRVPRKGGDAWNVYYDVNIAKIRDDIGQNDSALF